MKAIGLKLYKLPALLVEMKKKIINYDLPLGKLFTPLIFSWYNNKIKKENTVMNVELSPNYSLGIPWLILFFHDQIYHIPHLCIYAFRHKTHPLHTNTQRDTHMWTHKHTHTHTHTHTHNLLITETENRSKNKNQYLKKISKTSKRMLQCFS